jgi:antitoxin YefM
MQANFVLDSDELDYKFIDKIKEIFKNKRIELTISDSDDTQYLLASEENKEILLNSIANIEKNENLVTADSKIFK